MREETGYISYIMPAVLKAARCEPGRGAVNDQKQLKSALSRQRSAVLPIRKKKATRLSCFARISLSYLIEGPSR